VHSNQPGTGDAPIGIAHTLRGGMGADEFGR